MSNRRSFLKSAGALASSIVVGTAAAGNVVGKSPTDRNHGKSGVTAEEVGVAEKIVALLRDNKIKRAHELADEANVSNSLSQSLYGDGDVHLHTPHSKSKSEIACSLINMSDDRWLATGVCSTNYVDEPGQHPSVANQDEAYALTWDPDHWSSPDRTEENVYIWSAENFPDSNLELPTTMEMYQPDGVAYTTEVYHDGFDLTTNLQTELIRTEPHPDIGVTFDYEHTWAVTPGWLDLAITRSLFKVDLSVGDSWHLRESADP